jgi:hypothetical protein
MIIFKYLYRKLLTGHKTLAEDPGSKASNSSTTSSSTSANSTRTRASGLRLNSMKVIFSSHEQCIHFLSKLLPIQPKLASPDIVYYLQQVGVDVQLILKQLAQQYASTLSNKDAGIGLHQISAASTLSASLRSQRSREGGDPLVMMSQLLSTSSQASPILLTGLSSLLPSKSNGKLAGGYEDDIVSNTNASGNSLESLSHHSQQSKQQQPQQQHKQEQSRQSLSSSFAVRRAEDNGQQSVSQAMPITNTTKPSVVGEATKEVEPPAVAAEDEGEEEGEPITI